MSVSPGSPVEPGTRPSAGHRAFAKVLRAFSIVTMLMTVPQVVTVWTGPAPRGVSLISWSAYLVSACLWLVYGLQRRDKTIYLACLGWILLDVAVILGVLMRV